MKVFLIRYNAPSDNIFIVKTVLFETWHRAKTIGVIFKGHLVGHIDGTLKTS